MVRYLAWPHLSRRAISRSFFWWARSIFFGVEFSAPQPLYESNHGGRQRLHFVVYGYGLLRIPERALGSILEKTMFKFWVFCAAVFCSTASAGEEKVLKEGDDASGLSATDQSGKTVKFADFKDKT